MPPLVVRIYGLVAYPAGMRASTTPPMLPAACARNDLVHRSIMRGRERHRIGLGFLDKAGRTADATRVRTIYWSVQLVMLGSAWYEDDRGTRERLLPGSVFQRLPDRVHTTTIDTASRYVECFAFLDPALWRSGVSLGLLDPRHPVRHGLLDLGLVRRLNQVQDRLRHARSEDLPDLALEVMRLGGRMLRDSTSPTAATDRAVEGLCQCLADNPAGRWSLPSLARGTGLSWERLRKLFTARTGQSPQSWRLHCRMDRARELLLASDAPIGDIASELGYPSAFAFSAQFKRSVGIAPSRFRGR